MNYLGSLAAGYTVEQVLNYLSKNFPELGPRIKEAVNSGKKSKDILEYLGKFDRKQLSRLKSNKKPFEPFPESSNPYIQGQQATEEYDPIPQPVKQAAKAGLATAAGSVISPMVGKLASQYAPQVSNALKRALPSNFSQQPQLTQQLGEQIAKPPMISDPNQHSLKQPTQQPPVNQVAANIPEPAHSQQDKEKSNIVSKLWTNFEKGLDKGFDFESDAFLKIAKRMKSTGEIRSREDFEKFFQIFDQKKNEGKALPTALKEASIEYDNHKLSPEKGVIPEVEEKKSPKIEKNTLVSSPNGVGSVKEIRNGQAIIDVDGKLHKVKEEELETSPLPEKELSELFDDLVSGIEKETGEDVSRMVQWAGYNPETNTLQFLPHTGKLYKYGNISPEDAALLTDILSVRKTSGSNFIGAWKKDSKSPIGAALSKLIRKLQSERGGKGNEYEETHEPIYSAYEPAINAKKKKKK
ncbi:MAG TPA: hypothetical protein VFE71_01025 [Bacteroidales bacterium]|nr:hypothetical protein [Bacteroidales bacterium]